MNAEIIAIGSELLTPFRQDTNSLFLTAELNKLSVDVDYKTVVGDERNRRPRNDLGEAFGRLLLVAGAAHDVGTGGGERVDLAQRAVDVGRLRGRHRLHGDGSATAHGHVADVDLAGKSSFVHRRPAYGRAPERAKRVPVEVIRIR